MAEPYQPRYLISGQEYNTLELFGQPIPKTNIMHTVLKRESPVIYTW
jgi:hypothetical protein